MFSGSAAKVYHLLRGKLLNGEKGVANGSLGLRHTGIPVPINSSPFWRITHRQMPQWLLKPLPPNCHPHPNWTSCTPPLGIYILVCLAACTQADSSHRPPENHRNQREFLQETSQHPAKSQLMSFSSFPFYRFREKPNRPFGRGGFGWAPGHIFAVLGLQSATGQLAAVPGVAARQHRDVGVLPKTARSDPIHIYIYICRYIYIYVCVFYIHTCVYIYTYIHFMYSVRIHI